MKIRTNCHNPQCLAKNSMIPITTKIFYSIKKEISNFNSIQEKEYRTWKPLTLFYICKKCGFMSDFKSNDIRGCGIFWICLVPKEDEIPIDKIKSMKKPNCLYCGLSIFPANPQKNETTQNNIIKLWLKDKFFGYFCKVHGLAFCKKIEEVTWDNISDQYKGTGTFNVLDPLNNLLSKFTRRKENEVKKDNNIRKYELDLTNKSIPQCIISKQEWFDEKKCLLIDYVEFEKIGGFPTTLDIDEKIPQSQYIQVAVPTSKLKRIKKLLENKGCEIIN